MTIIDAVAAAGGFSAIADKNTVILRREVKGKVVTQVFKVAEISAGKQANVIVLPGDMIMIEERMF
jgi:polysaccharide export outer membrane protein